MRAKQFASLIVMVLYLAGCHSWRVQPVAPQQLFEGDPPSKVRVLTKQDQKLVFKDPSVRDGALWGHVDGNPTRIPLDEIAQVEKEQTDAVRTVVLGVGIAAVVALIVAAYAFSQLDFCSWSTN